MGQFYELYPHDSKYDDWIFSEVTQQKDLIVRPMYEDLVCPECKKVNELAALERGLDERLMVRDIKEVFGSLDDCYIVSQKVRSSLDSIPEVVVRYLAIPRRPDYFVAVPANIVNPSFEHPALRTNGHRCSSCGRWYWAGWTNTARFPIPGNIKFGAMNFHGGEGLNLIWFADSDIVALLRNAKVKGFAFIDQHLT
jgi:hypothetical protein